jgi:hypothetical protein
MDDKDALAERLNGQLDVCEMLFAYVKSQRFPFISRAKLLSWLQANTLVIGERAKLERSKR